MREGRKERDKERERGVQFRKNERERERERESTLVRRQWQLREIIKKWRRMNILLKYLVK